MNLYHRKITEIRRSDPTIYFLSSVLFLLTDYCVYKHGSCRWKEPADSLC